MAHPLPWQGSKECVFRTLITHLRQLQVGMKSITWHSCSRSRDLTSRTRFTRHVENKKAGGFLANALKRSSNPCSVKHGWLWAIPISDACEQNALHKCVGCMPTLCSSWKAVIFEGTCIEYRCDDSCNHSASEAMQSNANCSSMQIKMRPWVPFQHLLKF